MLTGLRQHRRLRIDLFAKIVWLSTGEFHDVCRLVVAKLTGNGCVAVPPMTVYRLRRDFELASVPWLGSELIDAVGAGEYQLALDSRRISLHPSFLELASPRLIAGSIKALLILKLPVSSELLSECD